MMNLVESNPQKVELVPPPMPPIENKGSDKVCNESAHSWADMVGEGENRPGR
jgi:hypothetical protein